jgi:hypothetical protein
LETFFFQNVCKKFVYIPVEAWIFLVSFKVSISPQIYADVVNFFDRSDRHKLVCGVAANMPPRMRVATAQMLEDAPAAPAAPAAAPAAPKVHRNRHFAKTA